MAALLLVRAVASPSPQVCDQVGGTIKPFGGERLNKRLSHVQPGAFYYGTCQTMTRGGIQCQKK